MISENFEIRNRFFHTPEELKAAAATLTEWAKANNKEYTESEQNGFPINFNEFVAYRIVVKHNGREIYCNFELPICYRK